MGLDPGGAADRRRQFLHYEPDGALNPDSQLLMLMPQRLSQLVRGGHIPKPERHGQYRLAPVVQGYRTAMDAPTLWRELDLVSTPAVCSQLFGLQGP
jgi:hypothetical protein